MIITAKFASFCPCCNSQIRLGEKVEWSRGEKARHVACVGKPVVAATRTTRGASSFDRRRAAFRQSYGWDGVEDSLSYYASGLYDEES